MAVTEDAKVIPIITHKGTFTHTCRTKDNNCVITIPYSDNDEQLAVFASRASCGGSVQASVDKRNYGTSK